MGLGRCLGVLAAVTTLLGGLVALAAPGTLASTANEGLVRCADLSPGQPQDVYLYAFGDPQHPMVLKHQGYGTVTEYMPVAVGQYTVAMRPVGASGVDPSDRLRQLHGERRHELHRGQPRARRRSSA